MSGRIRITARSIRVLCDMDRHVRACDIRGSVAAFVDVAADPLDGAYFKEELADLIKRRLLRVVEYGFDDSMGPDPHRGRDQRLCGTSWSVNPTERLIRALWPSRLGAPSRCASPPTNAHGTGD
jgi:hypothetical protein